MTIAIKPFFNIISADSEYYEVPRKINPRAKYLAPQDGLGKLLERLNFKEVFDLNPIKKFIKDDFILFGAYENELVVPDESQDDVFVGKWKKYLDERRLFVRFDSYGHIALSKEIECPAAKSDIWHLLIHPRMFYSPRYNESGSLMSCKFDPRAEGRFYSSTGLLANHIPEALKLGRKFRDLILQYTREAAEKRGIK